MKNKEGQSVEKMHQTLRQRDTFCGLIFFKDILRVLKTKWMTSTQTAMDVLYFYGNNDSTTSHTCYSSIKILCVCGLGGVFDKKCQFLFNNK